MTFKYIYIYIITILCIIYYCIIYGLHGRLNEDRSLNSTISNRLFTIPSKKYKSLSLKPFRAIENNHLNDEQREIKNSVIYAWNAYKLDCFGQDDLKSDGSCDNWLGGIGATLIDSLDTLIILGMKKELDECRVWLETKYNPYVNEYVSFFETVIRVVGGFLSAYTLTVDIFYLNRASEMADILMNAFNNKHVLPLSLINLKTNHSKTYDWTYDQLILAEIGSFQMEFIYLSYFTGNSKYEIYANKVTDLIDNSVIKTPGLYPLFINLRTATFQERKHLRRYGWGALGDSAYEYILKVWILKGKKDIQNKRMYYEVTNALQNHLLRQSGNFLYVTNKINDDLLNTMDHLSCFLPGLLALGVYSGAVSNDLAVEHLNVAEKLMNVCVEMYFSTTSGLAAEISVFTSNNARPIVPGGSAEYFLRPETIESLFILYRVTKKTMYRDYGWRIYKSIETFCKVSRGYSGLKNVHMPAQGHTGKMESYFIAETLKYLYLLFSSDHVISLKDFVFNTEAHIFKVID